jgi:hypothetical protein
MMRNWGVFGLAVVVGLALGFSPLAGADQELASCVRGYAKASQKYKGNFYKLHAQPGRARTSAWVGVGAGIVCTVASGGSLIVFCAIIGGGITATSLAAKIAAEAKLKRLIEADRLYQAALGGAYTSARMTLMKDMGVSAEQEQAVVDELQALMEDGTLCGGGRTPWITYEDAVELLKSRLLLLY